MTSAAMDVLKALTTTSSILMCLSPAPSLFQIYKTKKIDDVSILPLVSLGASCHVWMLYGLFTSNAFPLLTTYGTGECLALIYVSVYFAYTQDKTYALKAIGAALLFVAVVSAYAVLGWQSMLGQTVDEVGNVIGFIGIGIVIVLYSSPFETLMQVLRTKSSRSMPILMIAVGTFSNGLWTLYAFLDHELLIAITNVTCLVFGAVQITLYLKYRPTRSKLDLPDSLEIVTPTFEYTRE